MPRPRRACCIPEKVATTKRLRSGTRSRTPIAVKSSRPRAVAPAVEALEDPDASGQALRHVLVGGVHAVEDFAAEVAEAEGGEPLPAHKATKIIGEVLAELD
jgi:hypothetical protein